MPTYVPLSKSAHRHAGLLPVGHAHALTQAVVPVVAEELPQVVPSMAVAFVAEGDGSYELVALQSLQPGVNVYVHTNGRWIGGYRPAWYRAHPFRLLQDSQTHQQVVCVDEQAEGFTSHAAGDAERLFDEQGELTQIARRTIAFLENLYKATEVTRSVVAQLAEAGVIVPWQLKLAAANGADPVGVQGLYHIDESALRTLPAPILAELAASGALSVAYAQLLSEHRLQGLRRLYDLRQEAEKQNEAAKEADLEDLFGDDDDDLSFNF